MAQYWIPPNEKPATIAPSLVNYKRGVGTDTTALSPVTTRTDKNGPPYPYPTEAEPGNPTVIPKALLSQFHFTFLIRHPRNSIPSYYRCTVPPLNAITGFYNYRPDEAGYVELRRFFDFLRAEGQIGPHAATGVSEAVLGNGVTNGSSSGVEICVIDADDLLDNPSGIIEAYCKSTGIKYEPEMLTWDTEEHHRYAKETFEKWKGFHEDAINSKELKARTHKKTPKSEDELLKEWTEKYGAEGAKIINDSVKENVEHYEYLKQFAIKL
ncbi:hypothetical protein DM02DRAFT_611148 [Periconia macrospinosa]|uniref:P-loop containing nucleoside triphosphate hydrolase protein n=1 Tax=Periconia macrospinosa TaxID=97972 RepID=A0A2V1E2K3_9PLEO|nr:hypothetical protein DM02DRAFT_611148 [Periconia macrospinosa]